MVTVVVTVAGGRVVHGVHHHRVIVRLAAWGQRENVAFVVLGQVIRRTILELELERRSRRGRESCVPSYVVHILGEVSRQFVSEAGGENLVCVSRIREGNENFPFVC